MVGRGVVVREIAATARNNVLHLLMACQNLAVWEAEVKLQSSLATGYIAFVAATQNQNKTTSTSTAEALVLSR